MKHLHSLGEMALELALRVPEVAIELHHGLELVAKRIEATAKGEFGHYQDAAGPFPGWPELAQSTKDDRVLKGFGENDPLLRTGDTRDTISHQVEGLEAAIGSPDEKMVWFEFGTARMPARPVLGPAAFTNKDTIQKLVGAALVSGLIGPVGPLGPMLPSAIHADLGYGMKTKD